VKVRRKVEIFEFALFLFLIIPGQTRAQVSLICSHYAFASGYVNKSVKPNAPFCSGSMVLENPKQKRREFKNLDFPSNVKFHESISYKLLYLCARAVCACRVLPSFVIGPLCC
jgi:hypothetical protein